VDSAASTPLVSPDVEAKLAKLGVSLLTIPPPTGEELHRLEGWRDNIERYGQDLWAIYHWIVRAQDGKTHGVYALAQWLEDWGVPDHTTQSGEYEEVFRARRS
jgi:hypothetical protein